MDPNRVQTTQQDNDQGNSLFGNDHFPLASKRRAQFMAQELAKAHEGVRDAMAQATKALISAYEFEVNQLKDALAAKDARIKKLEDQLNT